MRNLLNFLIKYNYWFFFVLLEVICFALLFRFNRYQEGVFFTSANTVVGRLYEVSGAVTSYFHLKEANEELLERNIRLEEQMSRLQGLLKEYESDAMKLQSIQGAATADYRIFKARVINNSLNLADNYITLNKGTRDGVQPDMAVVSGMGVVGIIYMASPSYSIVISLLNSKSNVSSKIKNSDYFGYLKWEGGDTQYAFLRDLPRHAEITLGDTVVTSGYSTVFPEGIIVGTVDQIADFADGLSYNLRIKLATDFGKLTNVRVLAREGQKEQRTLEQNSTK
ncbi:rod shape-determining protein MreC [Bacteroides sp. 214]|uniref:rod shape-determining protein MreC n=1 Tax=Bacteroides sp. 214 TaxID=2302935 RepID=UPI0013D0E9D5|nr:rod shape-determining protein MreC [Bacteroides sp. 214]NDW13842.1 rod shape-determining protein MreC [Bacteroides sp. 214]